MKIKVNENIANLIVEPFLITKGSVNLYIEVFENGEFIRNVLLANFVANDILIPTFKDERKVSYKEREYRLKLIADSEVELKETSLDFFEAFDKFVDILQKRYSKEAFAPIYSDDFDTVEKEDFLGALIKCLASISKGITKERLERKNRNESLASLELNERISQLGKIASFKEYVRDDKVKIDDDIHTHLINALIHIGEEYGYPKINRANYNFKEKNAKDALINFCNRSRIRYRKIDLDPKFYTDIANPIIGFLRVSKSNETFDEIIPVVIYLKGEKSYYLLREKPYPITQANAKDFLLEGILFYEPFNKNLTSSWGLLGFFYKKYRNVSRLVLLISIIAAIFSFMNPIATEYVVNTLIPMGDIRSLYVVGVLLLILTLGQIFVSIVPQIIMLFFSINEYERFEGILFDKLLRLKISALAKWERGDLANRLNWANQIQETVFEVITGGCSGAMFALSSVIIMLYYSKGMTLLAIIFSIIYIIIFVILAYFNFRVLREKADVEGKISSSSMQYIDAISKIKAANALRSIMSHFMITFTKNIKIDYIISFINSIQKILVMIFPSIVMLGFYILAYDSYKDNNLTLGEFLAFLAAFTTFQGGVIGVSEGLWQLISIKPKMERILPLLREDEELQDNNLEMHECKGNVSLINVSFRYKNSDINVLDEVNLEVKNGEYIAIVGPSGAGKSSIIKLLLGFEEPTRGAILYDKNDLSSVNIKSIRENLRVIIQNDKVFEGSILDNIVMGTDYSVKDAKKALNGAGFLDEVLALPMGIHTIVSPDNISGGQMQRILIARALVGEPKIIIMDEATSALDNQSQKIVVDYLKNLKVTRIVIAHRLSTIKDADRIYVLNKGRVVQQGTYDDLIKEDGLFKSLSKRELIE